MAYRWLVRSNPVTVAEMETFVHQAAAVWTDLERMEFIDYISRNPTDGDLIPQSGGVRKVRWGRQGTGKRGGVRVIYFYMDLDAPLYLLMVYAKAVRTDLSPDAKRAVKALADRLKRARPAKKSWRTV
jgi:hypothetical protein